jgi:putative ABC transport system ATP-binding protein
MSGSPVLLAAKNLARRMPDGDGWLLADVSLTLARGDRLAIVGASGTGKTLLLRALALLDSLDSGQVFWQDRSVAAGEVPGYRRQVQYLHQRAVLAEGTVEDNLRLPFALRTNAALKFDRRQAISALEKLGRDEKFLARSARDLSGGEAQMVAFVRGLQLAPSVLLLDEPTSSLDAESSQALERLVADWFDEQPGSRALAWVSHDRAQALRVSNRQLTMARGRLSAEERGQ